MLLTLSKYITVDQISSIQVSPRTWFLFDSRFWSFDPRSPNVVTTNYASGIIMCNLCSAQIVITEYRIPFRGTLQLIMVKFVPVSDVERPRDAQNLNSSANEKHRKFDNPHAVKKTVDRGWQQGNVGWGVLGAFGNSDKDDAAQIIKRSDGVNKMVKNEKGLWVKVKDLSDASNITSDNSSRGRGGGISVLGSLSASTSSSYEKNHPVEHDDLRSAGRSNSRFRDYSEDRNGRSQRDSGRRDRSRSRSRNSSEEKCNRTKHRSDDRHDNHSGDRRSHRGSTHSNDRRRHYDRSHSRSRSRSRNRKDKSRKDFRRDDSEDRDDTDPDDSRNRRKHRGSRRDKDEEKKRSQVTSPSSDRFRDKQHDKSAKKNASSNGIVSDYKESSDNGNDRSRDRKWDTDRYRDDRKNDKETVQKMTRGDDEKDDKSNDFVFDFTANQVANRFLEVFSGQNTSRNLDIKNSEKDEEDEDEEDDDDDDDEIKEDKKKKRTMKLRLDSIASLFTEDACVLSLKNGKIMLNGKKVIKESFSRTLPDDSKCTYRIVVDTENDIFNDNGLSSITRSLQRKEIEKHETGNENENENENKNEKTFKISYCLDFHAPNSSPGLGDRSKDTALLYRCVGSLLTHIWGAVDPDKLSSSYRKNGENNKSEMSTKSAIQSVKITKNIVLNSKCWNWAEMIIKNDFPLLPIYNENQTKSQEYLIFHDYDNIESWN